MIIFSHLLNDRSGSPKVLAEVIDCIREMDLESCLFLGSQGQGILDESGIPIARYWYRRGSHRLITMLYFFFSQLCLFLRLLRTPNLPTDAIVYVNTLLPFGAALYGALTGRNVIYHLHEVSVTPAPLRWLLTGIAHLTAKRLIYVSNFHHSRLPIVGVPATIIYNVVDMGIAKHAKLAPPFHPRRIGNFNVLMLSSLRDYKGVPEFLALARRLAAHMDVCFHLVANDDDATIRRYFKANTLPQNVRVHKRTSDPAMHYATASLVLNLTRPDLCEETFGLTLLEAMSFGIPVIAPPVGGPLELVSDGQEGFLVDSRDGDLLYQRVRQLAEDEALCLRMSTAARQRAGNFSHACFVQGIREALACSGARLSDCQGRAN